METGEPFQKVVQKKLLMVLRMEHFQQPQEQDILF